MVDLLVGASTNGTKRTYAGLSINGCFLMNDEYSDFDMTDTWTCFGDPSLYVRTDNPAAMTISHNSVIVVGESVFNVTCDTDEALATVSDNGVIVGSAVVTGGGPATRTCFICDGEANSAHGSAYSIYWLCDKHNKECVEEEKMLKQMVEIQALRNIKKRYLLEKSAKKKQNNKEIKV